MSAPLKPRDLEALDLYGSRLMRELDYLKDELLNEEEAPSPLDAETTQSLETSAMEFHAMLDGMQAEPEVRRQRIRLLSRVAIAAAALILATIFFLSYSSRKGSGSKSAVPESSSPNVGDPDDLASNEHSEFPEIAPAPNPISRSGTIPEPTTAMLIPCALLFLLRRNRKE